MMEPAVDNASPITMLPHTTSFSGIKTETDSFEWSNRMLLERIWGQVKQSTILLQSLHRCVLPGEIPSTTITEDFGLPLRSRPPAHLNEDTDTDSNESDAHTAPRSKKRKTIKKTPPAPPLAPGMPEFEVVSCITPGNGSGIVEMMEAAVENASPITMLPHTTSFSGIKTETDSFEWSNRTLLEQIWGQVEPNTIFLQSLHRRVLPGEILSTTIVEDFGLPLDSMEAFAKVESMLADKTQYNLLVSHLATIGGVTAKDVISLMLVHVIKTELAEAFNWKGNGQKKGLEGTLLVRAITDAAKRLSLKEAESVAELKKWLKNANDSEGATRKYKYSDEASSMDDSSPSQSPKRERPQHQANSSSDNEAFTMVSEPTQPESPIVSDVDEAIEELTTYMRKKMRCHLCGKQIANLVRHLIGVHQVEKEKAKNWRATMPEVIKHKREHSNAKNPRPLKTCSICGDITQRMDTHLRRKHQMSIGTARYNAILESMRYRRCKRRRKRR